MIKKMEGGVSLTPPARNRVKIFPDFLATVQCGAMRWNSFCGDVVLDSFIKAYGEKDSILNHKYEKRIFC